MSAGAPTPGRIVIVQTIDGNCPAIVVRVHDTGAVTVVAFSERWPLTAAHVFRNLPHASQRGDGVNPLAGGPSWLWPPRTPVDAEATPASSAEVSRELAREQTAFARVLAAMAERVTELERIAHPPARGMALAADVEMLVGLLERRVGELEALAAGRRTELDAVAARLNALELAR